MRTYKGKDDWRQKWAKANPERVKAIKHRFYERHKEELKRKQLEENHRKPEVSRAQSMVQYAINHGTLKRPKRCQDCNKPHGRIEAHHYLGYARENYLKVQWLCPTCHDAADKLQRQQNDQKTNV